MPKRESFVDRNFDRVPGDPPRFRCRACGSSCAHSTAYKVHRQCFEVADHQVPQLAQVQPHEHDQLDVDAAAAAADADQPPEHADEEVDVAAPELSDDDVLDFHDHLLHAAPGGLPGGGPLGIFGEDLLQQLADGDLIEAPDLLDGNFGPEEPCGDELDARARGLAPRAARSK